MQLSTLSTSAALFFANLRHINIIITRSQCLSDFRYLAPFRRYSPSKSEVAENRPKFCMFLAPHLLGGSAPRIFGLNLSNRTSFRSCGKVSRRSVEGQRRKAGERNLKKNITSKIEDLVLPNARPNNNKLVSNL